SSPVGRQSSPARHSPGGVLVGPDRPVAPYGPPCDPDSSARWIHRPARWPASEASPRVRLADRRAGTHTDQRGGPGPATSLPCIRSEQNHVWACALHHHSVDTRSRRGGSGRRLIFGSTAYLAAKAQGDSSMPVKRGASEDVYGGRPARPARHGE